MDPTYALKLLAAADGQRHGFIKLRGAHADHEVRLMVGAGLVEATLNDGEAGSFTSINRLTDVGDMFLRAFGEQPVPAPALPAPGTQRAVERQADSSAALPGHSKVNFAAELTGVEQASAQVFS